MLMLALYVEIQSNLHADFRFSSLISHKKRSKYLQKKTCVLAPSSELAT